MTKKTKLKILLYFISVFIILLIYLISMEVLINNTQINKGVWTSFSFTRLEKAKRSNTPVIVYFTANWCPYCEFFHRDVLAKPNIKDNLNKYVLLKVDRSNKKNLYTKLCLKVFRAKHIPVIYIIKNKDDYQKVLLAGKDEKFFNLLIN